jgi:hypothetical protein
VFCGSQDMVAKVSLSPVDVSALKTVTTEYRGHEMRLST